MNILITGCNRFVGQEAVEYFSHTNHTIIPTTRKELDVSNSKAVDTFFSTNKIDVVIHTAVKGGRRNSPDIFDNLVQNLMMFNNLARNSHKYQLMFNFGSGAEFDRRKKIEEVKEDDIFDHYPQEEKDYQRSDEIMKYPVGGIPIVFYQPLYILPLGNLDLHYFHDNDLQMEFGWLATQNRFYYYIFCL